MPPDEKIDPEAEFAKAAAAAQPGAPIDRRTQSYFTLALALGLLTIGIGWAWNVHAFVQRSAATDGEVISVHEVSGGRNSGAYPRIRFYDGAGEAHWFTGEKEKGNQHPLGATVPVIYDPAHPDHASINDWSSLYWWQTVLILLGVALSALALFRWRTAAYCR